MKFKKVNKNLLLNNNIKIYHLYEILEDISKKNIDYSDIYFQFKRSESWTIENKNIKDSSYFKTQGVGVRAVYKEQTGFSYSNKIDVDSIRENSIIASNIVNSMKTKKIKNFKITQNKLPYSHINPLNHHNSQEKIDLLFRIDKYARNFDKRVKEVIANISGEYDQILIASSDGVLATDVRPMVKVSITVQVESSGKCEKGFNGGGGRYSYKFLKDNLESLVDIWTEKAVTSALINLSSVNAPAGVTTLVLGPGWPGILLHEAVGHGLEADFNRKRISIFKDKIGTQVASNLCTIVDDGTLFSKRGSLAIDDEGTCSQYNILIEKGILKKYMQDKLNARIMDTDPTGNARRESYAHLPIPRMTNTYMLPGNNKPEDIIKSVNNGIYASNFNGGQVDITSGNFVFFTSEAFLIKNGKIDKPIKSAMIIGSCIDVMKQISMIGNDLSLDNGLGICGKEGQNVPVSVGQPTIKIDNITIGGTVI